jgi:hypothetical protein
MLDSEAISSEATKGASCSDSAPSAVLYRLVSGGSDSAVKVWVAKAIQVETLRVEVVFELRCVFEWSSMGDVLSMTVNGQRNSGAGTKSGGGAHGTNGARPAPTVFIGLQSMKVLFIDCTINRPTAEYEGTIHRLYY